MTSVKDKKGAKAYVKKQGGSEANYIGKTGTVVSNVNGWHKWKLEDGGSIKEVAFTTPASEALAKQATTIENTASGESSTQPAQQGNEALANGIEAAQTAINAFDNTALITIQAGFNAANKTSPSTTFANGAKVTSSASKVLGGIGIGLTIVDAANDPKGWQTKHTIDAVVGGLSFLPGVGQFIGLGWFVGNLISEAVSGRSLSENIQRAIED